MGVSPPCVIPPRGHVLGVHGDLTGLGVLLVVVGGPGGVVRRRRLHVAHVRVVASNVLLEKRRL